MASCWADQRVSEIDQTESELGVTKRGNQITIYFWNPQAIDNGKKIFFHYFWGNRFSQEIFGW